MRIARTLLLSALLAPAGAGEVRAQLLPEGPIRAFDGQVTIGGEIVATLGMADHEAYFNYTDYERNALRMMRLALSGVWRPLERVSFVGEVRTEDFRHADAFGAYVRVRPFPAVALDIQAGRIPPSFGAFGRRAYATDQILIGYPLAYQYLTSLRPDALPATPDDLLIMRGRGWLPRFPIGAPVDAPGVPLVSAFRWDTGVQGRWIGGPVEISAALTNGTLSDPRFDDNNGGKQVSGRVAVRPRVGLIVGASAARGSFLADDLLRVLPDAMRDRSYPQQAFGADAEYSRDHWIVRGEVVRSAWSLPLLSPVTTLDVTALAAWVEGRYRFTPRFFGAARVDHLGFSSIRGVSIWTAPTSWEAPVDRIEWGGGYYFQRNVIGRVVAQHNWRDGGRVRSRTFVSAQLSYWF
jgi:hypothetical protein